MSKKKSPRTSAHPPVTAEDQPAEPFTFHEQREALILPLTTGLRALWSKKTLALTSDEIHLLRLMCTLVRLSDLDSLQALPAANKAMPPEWWNS
jgi:hypothetical protein